jgi:hypothetical protein
MHYALNNGALVCSQYLGYYGLMERSGGAKRGDESKDKLLTEAVDMVLMTTTRTGLGQQIMNE